MCIKLLKYYDFMAQIFMIGDSHAYIYPINYQKWMTTFKQYFYDFYIPLLKKEAKPGDICIHLGDLFDNRNYIPIDVIVEVQKIVEEIAEILPFHLLIGNHDIFNKSTNDINAIRMYKHIPGVTIYEKTEQVDFNGTKLLMMPWVEHKNEQIALLRQYRDSDYVFCHSDLNGAKLHMKSVAHKNRDKIELDEFVSFKHVYSAHIHIVQVAKNFTFVGSIYQMDRGDLGNQKGVFILDTDLNEDKFIPNMLSPIFEKLSILTELDVEKLSGINTNNYVDLSISNSLLIGNRKLRRKLEKILETGGFSSVEYIDDINEQKAEETDVEKKLKETDFTIETNFEFEEMIKDYIQQQTYESDKTKLGVVGEYDSIIDIYNENYKFKKED